MPIYSYKGYDAATGAVRKGQEDGDSPKAVKAKLRAKKIIVSEIKEEAASKKGVSSGLELFAPRVKAKDVAVMTRQFATLQNAAVALDESLRALKSQVEDKVLRSTLQSIMESVSEGKSLGEAISNFPRIFSKLYVNMVRAGEQSGELGLVLDRLADYMEKQEEAKGQVVSAMTYPAVMILANVGLIGYLILSLVPKLQKVFVSLKAPLPWYTKLIVGLSEWLQANWFVLPIVFFMVIFFFQKWVRSEKGRRKFDEILLKLPVFGGLIMRMQISRFTQTLSTLLSSGVPIIRALDITKNVITNTIIAEVIETSKISVQEGKNLGQTIERSGKFPPLVTHMIMTGERTGKLEEMLGHVAVAYEAEVQRKIESMISLVEPVMIIFMAGSAGGIIAAVLVPMLSIMSQIR